MGTEIRTLNELEQPLYAHYCIIHVFCSPPWNMNESRPILLSPEFHGGMSNKSGWSKTAIFTVFGCCICLRNLQRFKAKIQRLCSFRYNALQIWLLLGRPERWVPDGLMFYRWCFFFLFRHAFSEVPRPIALKLCHMVGIWLKFIIPLQNSGATPPKKFGAKNMKNFGKFWTTSDFDRKYLRNQATYPKSERLAN